MSKTKLLHSLYGGYFGERNRNGIFYGYSVRFPDAKGYLEEKTFSITAYKTKEAALYAATEYQQVESDFRGFTKLYFASLLTNTEKSYIGGFFDGDGCCSISKRGHVTITVKQSQNNGIPKVLLFLQNKYGGEIYHSRRVLYNQRQQHEWILPRGFGCLQFLYDMQEFCILKSRQVLKAYISLIDNNSPNCHNAYDELHLAKFLHSYQSETIQKSRLTIPYIAGLFDAEGCIKCSSYSEYSTGITLTISQLSSYQLLSHINLFLDNTGQIDDGVLYWCGKNAKVILEKLLTYLIGKKEQAIYALKLHSFSTVNYRHRTKTVLQEIHTLRMKIGALKKI